jgi:phosphohistidine phosphatase
MKRLTLVRHAKSSWADPEEEDADRPLSPRGRRDAPRMGKRLRRLRLIPDEIVTSPARRARKTAALLAEALELPRGRVHEREGIYEADAERLLEVIRSFEDAWDHVLLVGHNPGLTELWNRLTGLHLPPLTTTGTTSLDLAIVHWKDVVPGAARLLFFDCPANYRQGGANASDAKPLDKSSKRG